MTACAQCGTDVKYCSKKAMCCKLQRGLWTALIDAKIVTKKGTWLEQSLYEG